jgi:hypothetical protein
MRFLPIFGEKFGVFLKIQCYDEKFAQFSFVLSQKRQFCCWSIRQDSTSSDGNASRSQNECIGIISGSLYTQANKRGIEECMGENHEGEKG